MPKLVFLLLLFTSGVCSSAEKPLATGMVPVHPVLIRNDHNPLLRVNLEMPATKDARATAFTFSLNGTTDLGDLESLQLFSCGDKPAFSAATSFGAAQRPAVELKFAGDVPLRSGHNYFWLSCRLKSQANLLHRIAASCSAAETSVGKLDPAAQSAGAHRIGIALRKQQEGGVHTSRIPALTVSKHGTLLCVFDMRYHEGRDLQEDIDIGLCRSTSGGQEWEPTRVIMDMGTYGGLGQNQNGCSDPGIIADHQTGEIFCFAVWMNGKPGKHQWTGDGSEPGFEIGKSAQFLMVRSQDDGVTWSKPENLTRKLKRPEWILFVPSPQGGIQLPDGTLVMPVQGRDARDVEFSTIMISRDHGKNWSVGNPTPSRTSECQVVALEGNTILLNARNEERRERFRAVYVTRDFGATWTAHATNRKTLIEPNCNGSLLRVDYRGGGIVKRALIFANPHSQTERSQHSLQVSFDDGQTWPNSHRLLLDEGRGAGYPSLTLIDERHIGVVYEGSGAQLVFEKFELGGLLKGK